ncbi:T9SS type A sorting domain-containing protein [Spirosoma gilvum]
MKTNIKSFALALSLGLVSTVSLFAETNPGTKAAHAATFKTGIYTTVSGKLNVALDKEKGGPVDIRLKSADGRVLYNYRLGKKEQAYRTQLNLSELEDGVYQLEVTNGAETTTQSVTLSTHKPTVASRVIAVQ